MNVRKLDMDLDYDGDSAWEGRIKGVNEMKLTSTIRLKEPYFLYYIVNRSE